MGDCSLDRSPTITLELQVFNPVTVNALPAKSQHYQPNLDSGNVVSGSAVIWLGKTPEGLYDGLYTHPTQLCIAIKSLIVDC